MNSLDKAIKLCDAWITNNGQHVKVDKNGKVIAGNPKVLNKPREKSKSYFFNNIHSDMKKHLKEVNNPSELITSGKCSKSAVNNAIYYANKGENVKLHVGNMQQKVPNKVSHVWIEHNGEICQTNNSKNHELFSNSSITIPNNEKEAKETIKRFLMKWS